MYRNSTRLRSLVAFESSVSAHSRWPVFLFSRNIRLMPKLKKRTPDQEKPPHKQITLDQDEHGNPKLTLNKLIQILPTLPAHQQKVLKDALEAEGAEKLQQILDSNPEFAADLSDGNEQSPEHPVDDNTLDLGSGYTTASELLQTYLQSSGILENPQKHDKQFWSSVTDFSKMKPGPDDSIPFEFLATLFEVAKLQPKPRLRPKYVKLVGDMLYSTKKVRLDPFNEVEYMDALCLFGNYYRAIEIWKSRSDDKCGSIYWLEVGSLYYQQAHNLAQSEAIANRSAELHDGYIAPRVIMGFMSAYSQLKQFDQVDKWYKQLLKLLDQGIETQSSAPKSAGGNEPITQEDAFSLLNRKKLPNTEDVEALLRDLLKSRNWEYSAFLIDEMKRRGIDMSLESTLATLDATTRRMVEYEPAAYNSKRRHIPATESNKKLTVLITRLISSYPELLDNSKFYESWLRGLAGLDLYENALMVIDAMVNRGIKIRASHMHTVIKALLAKNQKELAEKLLVKMETATDNAVYPAVTSTIYALFIQYGARRSDDSYIRNILGRMDSRGIEHSQATFNTLMFYYYRHHDYNGVFLLYRNTMKNNGGDFDFFDQVNFRTLWLIFRDFYRTKRASSIQELVNGNNDNGGDGNADGEVTIPDLRLFFQQMIHSKNFRLSLNVYEYVMHTFMLSGDWEAFCGVLCHLESVNNIKLQSELVTSMLQLAYKLKTNSKFAFARPTKKDLLVSPGHFDPKEPSIPWTALSEKLFMLMEFPEPDIMVYINAGKSLCDQWNS